MRAVIIGNGSICDYEYIKSCLRDDDHIICADGGARHAQAMGITADVLIGDFDSLPHGAESAARVIEYPSRKNFTDGELCVDYAVEHGFSDVLLIGMTGSRLDHTINNIFLLFKCRSGRLIDEHNEIFAFEGRLEIKNRRGKTLSIIPVDGDIEGITTSGLEYPLDNETLYFGRARGNSNVVVSDGALITAEKGRGIVIVGNGE